MYILGIAIVLFGLAFFLRNLGFLDFAASFWYVFYPVIIIGFGFILICITHEGRKLLKKIKRIFSVSEEETK